MVVLAVIAAAGAAAWIYQTMFGLGVTGMNNGTSWGLYIAAFMFFVGLSAGGLIVASSASIFHVTEFKKVALPAVCVSTVCICCAGLLVILDLGGVARIFNLIISRTSSRLCSGTSASSRATWSSTWSTCTS